MLKHHLQYQFFVPTTNNQAKTITEGEEISVTIQSTTATTTSLDVTIKIEETTTASSTNILDDNLQNDAKIVTIPAGMSSYTYTINSQQDTSSSSNGEVVISLVASTANPVTYNLVNTAVNQKVTYTVNNLEPTINIYETGSTTSRAKTINEGEEISVDITRSATSAEALEVTIMIRETSAGTPAPNILDDSLQKDAEIVTIPANMTTFTYTIASQQDRTSTNNGEVVITLVNANTYHLPATAANQKVTFTVNHTSLPRVSIAVDKNTVFEGESFLLTISVTPAPTTDSPLNVQFVREEISDPEGTPNRISGSSTLIPLTSEISTYTLRSTDLPNSSKSSIYRLKVLDVIGLNEDPAPYVIGNAIEIVLIKNFLPEISIETDTTSITEGGDFEITLTANPRPRVDLPITLSISDNNLGYLSRFNPSSITMPTTSDSLTVTVYIKVLLANNPSTNFRITVGQDTTNTNVNLRYTPKAGSSFVEVNILNSDKPVVQITSTANESSVVESSAFTFTLMVTPPPATDEILSIPLTLEPASTPYLDTSLNLTYEVDSTGMLDVTVPTNLQAPDVASETIKIEIVANTDLYLIRDDYHKIEFGLIKVAETTKSIISITSDSDGESISEGQGFSFRLAAFEPPASDLEVHLTISDSGFIEPDLTNPMIITTSGTLDVDVMTQADAVSEEGGEIKISIAEHLNYFISGRENQISITVQNVSAVISISADDGPHAEGSPIILTVTSSEPPANSATINIELSEMVGDKILTSSSRTFQVELTSERTSGIVSIRTQKNGVHMHGGSLTATATTTSTDVILAQGEISISVVDSDNSPSISISTEAASVTEGGTGAEITLTAANTVSNIELPITLEIDDGDHNFFTNANPDPVVVNLPARMESVTHTITPQDDTVAERSGSFTVEVTSETTNTNYTVADSPNHIISMQFIDDDIDDLPELSVTPVEAEITEGGDDDNVVNASFKVAVDPDTTASLTVRYEVIVLGNYLQNQENYNEILTPPITFNNGEYTIDLPIENDDDRESRGIITFKLHYETANLTYRIDADMDTAEISVLDDDGGEELPKINISAEDSVVEGEDITFTLTTDPNATIPASGLTIFISITQTGNYLTVNTDNDREVTLPPTGPAIHMESTSWLDESIRNGIVMAEIKSEPMSPHTYSIGTEFRVSVEVEVYRGPIVSVTPPNAPITAGTCCYI